MLKLSIIIPVYNVEQYVSRCIMSCIEQDNFSYEIIVVNDGSVDKSLEIVQSLAEKYHNIFVVSQENSGPGAARNKGLSLAKGEYVWFIDSDDWIDSNCLNDIIEQLDEIDVLAMGYKYIEDDKISIINVSDDKAKSGRQLMLSYIFMANPFYIYKRSFLEINNLCFFEGILHEDFEFVPRMLYCTEKLKVYKNVIYNYFMRVGSIMTSVNPKKSFDMVRIADLYFEFSANIGDEKYKRRFNDFISLAINNSLNNSLKMGLPDKEKLSRELSCRKNLFRSLRNSNIVKYKIEGFIFSLFPKNVVFLYKILFLIKNIY